MKPKPKPKSRRRKQKLHPRVCARTGRAFHSETTVWDRLPKRVRDETYREWLRACRKRK